MQFLDEVRISTIFYLFSSSFPFSLVKDFQPRSHASQFLDISERCRTLLRTSISTNMVLHPQPLIMYPLRQTARPELSTQLHIRTQVPKPPTNTKCPRQPQRARLHPHPRNGTIAVHLAAHPLEHVRPFIKPLTLALQPFPTPSLSRTLP